jgi:peptide/nickel transport system permease protein
VLTFIARRLAVGVLIVWLVSVIVFLATQLLPGDAANELLGRFANPASIAALQRQMHLDSPAIDQYGRWLQHLVTLHWGQSLVSASSVASIVRTGAENTGLIMLLTTVIATPIALVVGSYSALRSDGIADKVVSVLTLFLVALPSFVIAVALVFLLATSVSHVLPATSTLDPSRSVFAQLRLVVLPTITLVLAVLPYPTRMIRASMLEVLRSDYVLVARLHGLSERRVVFLHAVPNAVVTTIQATALNLVFLAGGVVIVETVFAYPGIGYAFVQAVDNRNIPVVQTLTVVLAAFYVVINLVADVLTVLATPRLRTSGRARPADLDARPMLAESLG